jgi:Pretoxin HINT domain
MRAAASATLAMVVATTAFAAAGCDVGSAFHCNTSAQCGKSGQCEPTGFCSFADPSCGSKQRYGQYAGSGFAYHCTDDVQLPDMATNGGNDGGSGGGGDMAGGGGGGDMAMGGGGGSDFALGGGLPDFAGPPSDGPTTVDLGDGGAGCFAAGTMVTMGDGSLRAIELLLPGDLVLSYDVTYMQPVVTRVSRVFVHASKAPIYVINGALRVTGNHPMFANGMWVPAAKLTRGDVLLADEDFRTFTITSIAVAPAEAHVYNIEVESGHGFFVAGAMAGMKTMMRTGATGGRGAL